MKILAIHGSPRKGNTYRALKQLHSSMSNMGRVDFRTLHLSEANLKTCTGCFLCLSHGKDFCSLKDDRDKILKQIFWADGVLLASPVYVMNVTSHMKNFIDRLAFVCHRPRFFHAHALVLSTVGGIGLKELYKYLKMIASVWGFRSVDKILLHTPPTSAPKLIEQNLEQIDHVGRKFYRTVKNRKWKPGLGHLIQFYVQRAIFTVSDGRADLPRDYEFYNKLKNKKFYIKAKTGIIKPIIGSLLAIFFKKKVMNSFK